MKRLLSVLAAGVLSIALAVGGSAVAEAKTAAKVYVNSNTTYLIAKGKKATVKPQIIKEGKVKIKSAKITVKKGKKTVAKNKSSVKLEAGTYKVTTTVKYTKDGKKKVHTGKKTQTVKVKTFDASAEAPKLIDALNKSRATALKDSGLTAAELKLARNGKLDALAAQYAAQSAAVDRFVSPDYAALVSGFQSVDSTAVWTGSPYKSFVTSASSYLLNEQYNPFAECGRTADQQSFSCQPGDVFKHIGVGFAVSKSGKIYTWVLLAAAPR